MGFVFSWLSEGGLKKHMDEQPGICFWLELDETFGTP